jgi:hypothetical protein
MHHLRCNSRRYDLHHCKSRMNVLMPKGLIDGSMLKGLIDASMHQLRPRPYHLLRGESMHQPRLRPYHLLRGESMHQPQLRPRLKDALKE